MSAPSVPDRHLQVVGTHWRLEPAHWLLLALVSMVVLHLFVPIVRVIPRVCFWGGATMAVLGLVLGNLAALRLRRAGTPLESQLLPTALLTDGVYGRSRNPIYLAMLLLLAGEAVMLGTAGALLPLPAFFIALRYGFIAAEERALQGAFGEAYAAYRRRVRRWL